jgi:hypothetical protein
MKKILGVVLALAIVLGSGPMLAIATGRANIEADWRNASRESVAIAPHPAAHEGAVVQVYVARAFSWRGAFGVHSWIAAKAPGALDYEVYEVIGWRSRWGRPVVSASARAPDARWYGATPELLLDLRGAEAEDLLEPIRDAVDNYPFSRRYEIWPGPNSNTFVAHVIREVPGLELELPVTAIGKDYLPGGVIARSLSGTGYQLSLKGLIGVTAAWDEGIEFNLLGLSFGIDFKDPAIKLPGLGRLGVQ